MRKVWRVSLVNARLDEWHVFVCRCNRQKAWRRVVGYLRTRGELTEWRLHWMSRVPAGFWGRGRRYSR